MPGFYKYEPNEIHAYDKDGSSNEYYGWAASKTLVSHAHWQIIKLVYTGDNWIEHFPRIDSSSEFSDQPIFQWDNVESYTYGILGT